MGIGIRCGEKRGKREERREGAEGKRGERGEMRGWRWDTGGKEVWRGREVEGSRFRGLDSGLGIDWMVLLIGRVRGGRGEVVGEVVGKGVRFV